MDKATYIHGTDESEQERLALLNRLTNPPFLDFLNCPRARSILELGSGLGILVHDCARRYTHARVFGIEYSPDQLSRVPSADRVHFTRADAHKLPFVSNTFDVTYCRYVLEHVAHPVDVLREMRRVLKPGGKALAQENNILVSVFDPDCPAYDHVWKQFAVLQQQLGGDALIGKRLFRYFSDAGFEKIELSFQPEIHHSGSPSFGPWVENLIGNIRSGEQALTKHGLVTPAEIEGSIAELRALMDRIDASALFYWNRALGHKL
jgi:ubiquinone/menaquinone biosynthesis C-methylase UbiE